jgi:mono/diheme cytochrome c family protein
MRLAILILGLGVICQAASPLQQAPPQAAAKVNPFNGQERAWRAGQKLYERECSACHGKQGEGLGKRPPLASPDVAQAPAGAVEWVVRNGAIIHGMPSFAHLPEPERWQIVTYVRTLSGSRESR